jgi:hypothetical protein
MYTALLVTLFAFILSLFEGGFEPLSQAAITTKTFRELLAAGSACKICLVGQNAGFRILIRYGRVESVLSGVRGSSRLFSSLNTAVAYLARLGIVVFEVDATDYKPGRLRPPRPDRAKALKETRRSLKQERLI